jgi:hypothetical protein
VKAHPRERFSSQVTLTPTTVATYVVELRGRIQGQDGHTALGAKGRVLVTDRL